MCRGQRSDSLGVPTFAHEGVLLHQWRIRGLKIAYRSAGSIVRDKIVGCGSTLAPMAPPGWPTYQIKHFN
jgi:hypothetical protein